MHSTCVQEQRDDNGRNGTGKVHKILDSHCFSRCILRAETGHAPSLQRAGCGLAFVGRGRVQMADGDGERIGGIGARITPRSTLSAPCLDQMISLLNRHE